MKEDEIDFSMDRTPFREAGGITWLAAIFSKTLVPFHGVLILAIVVVMFTI